VSIFVVSHIVFASFFLFPFLFFFLFLFVYFFFFLYVEFELQFFCFCFEKPGTWISLIPTHSLVDKRSKQPVKDGSRSKIEFVELVVEQVVTNVTEVSKTRGMGHRDVGPYDPHGPDKFLLCQSESECERQEEDRGVDQKFEEGTVQAGFGLDRSGPSVVFDVQEVQAMVPVQGPVNPVEKKIGEEEEHTNAETALETVLR